MTFIYWPMLDAHICVAIEDDDAAAAAAAAVDMTIACTTSDRNRKSILFNGTGSSFLKQTNNEIVASKIDQRLHRMKTTQKSCSHGRVIKMISLERSMGA